MCVAHLAKILSEFGNQKFKGVIRFAQALSELLRKTMRLQDEQSGFMRMKIEAGAAHDGHPNALINELRMHQLLHLFQVEVALTNSTAEWKPYAGVIVSRADGRNWIVGGAEAFVIPDNVLSWRCR
jgi:hypothetical protein